MEQAEVLRELADSGALLEGHFQLSSGLHSDRYFQCALALSDPARAERLARALAAAIHEPVDVVVGPALGAVTWAHELARALGVRSIFTERQAGAKGGAMELRRGFRLERGERVLVVEDVLTTGGSVREVFAVVRALGAEVVRVGAIVDRSARDPFADDGVPLSALARVEAKAWPPADCPLCAAGGVARKPGSRPGAMPDAMPDQVKRSARA